MIVFISDFDLTGSGYMNIAIASCNQLAKHGWSVKALGMGYSGAEHNWDFSIIPVPHGDAFARIPAMIHNFKNLGNAGQVEPVDAIIVALDIPMQARFLGLPTRTGIPYIGIFPVESGPLCLSWAHIVSSMNERLVISKFGLRQMEKAGVEGNYFPVGIDTEAWRPPQTEERKMLRESMGYTDEDFVVLTVADNQERKNLSRAAEIIMNVAEKKPNVRWALVTRKECPVGWRLDDLLLEMGILQKTTIYERGLPHDRLWVLHATSDAFLLTSKAEGLCMPVMEAMATKLPVIATECTAMPEHLWDDPIWDREEHGVWMNPSFRNKPRGQRGFLVPSEYYTRDPWGNSFRAFCGLEDGIKTLINVMEMKESKMAPILDAGRAYAESRTWDIAGDVLHEVVSKAVRENQAKQQQAAPQPVMPPTIPQPVPIQTTPGGIIDEQESE